MGKLTALDVARAIKPGMYGDGDGLWLQVKHANAKSWVLRYHLNGRDRYLGLGSASVITLKRARELAVEPRRLCAEGIDPIDTKRAQHAAAATNAARAVSFKQCAENYIAAHEQSWKSEVHRRQWRTSMEQGVYPVIGNLPVRDIDTPLVLKVLHPIWNTKPESASRIRGRIETVLNAAKSAGLRSGENPATWRGHLQNLLPKPQKVRQTAHHPVLPYRDLPAFMQALRLRQGFGARALELTILTAARTAEVLGAQWSEIDFNLRVWAVPATRTKTGKEHRVPLAPCAIDLLQSLNNGNSEFVFPGNLGKSLSAAAMPKVLELMGRTDITVHGFRSTFRDWAAETTAFPHEVVEMALAHTVGTAVERAYRRSDLFERRARLMDEWARFCEQPRASADVVPIRK
ncbi:MAG TPA: integrase arm-type DNA-binding domain-containing protein [Xanthobacteraceae bacterium]|nr:integrase arm-type DNA-binding domain-containing protein [Xanthobacteraceae bacterium]